MAETFDDKAALTQHDYSATNSNDVPPTTPSTTICLTAGSATGENDHAQQQGYPVHQAFHGQPEANPVPPFDQSPPPPYMTPGGASPLVSFPPAGDYYVPSPNPVIIRQTMPVPQTYYPLSIITCLFFCWVFGLIAIIRGSQVHSLYLSGNYAGAIAASNAAKSWSLSGIVIGALIYSTILVVYFVW